MPIYEYKCSNCGNELEVMQKISDEPLEFCPRCQGKLEKQWSLSGFQFKGSGWYVSDYTNRSKENAAAGETKSSSDGKSESKTSESSCTNDAANKPAASTTESTASSNNASKTETKNTKTD